MSLPSNWVDKIFTKLTLVYGHQFLSRWDGMPIEDVKADWGHELSRFQQSPDSITFALSNLPARPPTVLEFREIARSAWKPQEPQQPAITHEAPPDPVKLAEAFQRLQDVRKTKRNDPKQWAYNLQAREQEQPESLSNIQRRFYKEALGLSA